ARDGGRARIYSETSGFALRDGRTAELVYEGADAGDWEFVAANVADSWDNWVNDRERYLAQRLRYDVQYYDSYVWGAEDLDVYGEWAYVNDYGWIWRPHTTVINNYYNWAPYRYGRWCWVPPYGWTWVGQEPWGWAPYHYGRWVYYNNYWAWCPRSNYYRHRSWWRPALVAFNISFGNEVCWYPLSYHQRDPHSRNYYGSGRRGQQPGNAGPGLRPLRSDELAALRRVNPAYYRAVTALPAKDFGAEGPRLRPVDDALARRVVSAEPLRTDLPIRPAYALNDRQTSGERTERVIVARPAAVNRARELPDRPTGAAERSPGVALDNELRRSRILNGRDARPEMPVPGAGVSGAVEARPTGAVARPARPTREVDPLVGPRNDGGRDAQRLPDLPASGDRPARPEVNERAPARVPVRPPANEEGSSSDRPARPERIERTERPDRSRSDRLDQPARPESSEPARAERPERRERSEAPPARQEPPPRNDPPPR
ncbi:MAG TPA: hypothetical protein DCK99_02590, partial [Blastocatellia bacterium]|nr:hypothetical protein [Blastocatellia bacterium]